MQITRQYKFITLAEAARLSGYSASRVYVFARDETFPDVYVKAGSRYYERQPVLDWLKKHADFIQRKRKLSEQQCRILYLLSKGYNGREIAKKMNYSYQRVYQQITQCRSTLLALPNEALFDKAVELGLISPSECDMLEDCIYKED